MMLKRLRFAVKKATGCSVGAVYACIANLPREIMFKKKYTALLAVIPGPKEPPGLCMNKVSRVTTLAFKDYL